MPKAKKKPAPVAPVAPAPPPVPVPLATQQPPASRPDLPVLYDRLEIEEYSTASQKGPLTAADWKVILGWETEKEYQARKVKEVPSSKPEHWLFGDVYHCKNLAGEKVRCHNNAHNRPFDDSWCESLTHTILYGQWAGPFTVPGETVNCETVRISRYGRVLSGQHEGTACILADEWLHKHREQGLDHPDHPKYPVWRTHGGVFIETIVCKGCSEDPRILMTVDYVKPRTAADVFYTTDTFREATPPERKELCRMLATASDTLWTRTDARGYRTHPEIVGFLDRHKRLLRCVEHLFAENSVAGGRKISKLRLSPGQCAALCYLMAASETTPEASDSYRCMDTMEAPTEKNVDFGAWNKAKEFWTLLGSGPDFMPVRQALGRLVDSEAGSEDNQGLGGRGPEKLAILAKAWEVWRDHPPSAGAPFRSEDLEPPDGALCLSYSDLDDRGNKLPDGQIKLLDVADFQGIDCPVSVSKSGAGRGGPPMPPPPTREEIERATQEALARRKQTK